MYLREFDGCGYYKIILIFLKGRVLYEEIGKLIKFKVKILWIVFYYIYICYKFKCLYDLIVVELVIWVWLFLMVMILYLIGCIREIVLVKFLVLYVMRVLYSGMFIFLLIFWLFFFLVFL